MKKSAIVFVLAALATAGCTTTRAQTPVERPALDVPPVPPRIIDPAPPPELPLPEPVPDLPEKTNAPAPKPRPTPPASREPSRDTAKPDPQKSEIPPVEPPPPPPVASSPAPLRTPATADTAAADRRVRDSLSRTQKVLSNIDYQRLTAERQTAYQQAQSHIEGAQTALNAQNFELAKEMADKAEKLGRELQSR
jgi:hypothetical protein